MGAKKYVIADCTSTDSRKCMIILSDCVASFLSLEAGVVSYGCKHLELTDRSLQRL